MSRSLAETTNRKIAKIYLSWDSENACLKYFDKSLTDDKNPKGTNVLVKLPFTFVPLDVLYAIKGFSDTNGAIYSNEIKNLAKQELVVKYFKTGEFATGLYADIKERIASKGGKFCSSVYIGYFEGKDLVIGNLQIVGASLGAWIDFCKENPKFLDEGAVKISGFTNEKKGATKYTKPVFEKCELSADTQAKAVELDKQLQAYLLEYFKGVVVEKDTQDNVSAAAEHSHEEQQPVSVDESNELPF